MASAMSTARILLVIFIFSFRFFNFTRDARRVSRPLVPGEAQGNKNYKKLPP